MLKMVTFTFIRHGQSTDNVKRVWAGWKDAPLSNHGIKQATSLGNWFSDKGVHFTAILSSTLDRAATTAEVILNHQPEPHPPHIKSLLLREQHFGIAEGKVWSKRLDHRTSIEEHYNRGVFPNPVRRSDHFPGGESRDDLAVRAERAIDELLLPYVLNPNSQQGPTHIAVISHGLFIREIVDALYRRDSGRERMLDIHRSLSNTGWTKAVVKVKRTINPTSALVSNIDLSVQITAFNEHEHLDNLVRQKGGIGSLAHDPKQKDIRGFFAGASSKP